MSADVVLDGRSLDLASLLAVARGGARVAVGSWVALDACRQWLDGHVEDVRAGRAPFPIYGVTTGFGSAKNVRLTADEVEAAQVNLLRSHAVGVAVQPDDWFDDEVVRATALMRANTFLAGRSGVRRAVVESLVGLLNAGVQPRMPQRGSVGASGDLCPLAHFALVLIGEGRATLTRSGSWRVVDGAEGLAAAGIAPLSLSSKEGLALINGTTVSTACLALALADAEALVRTADVGCALAVEALGGHGRALDPQVHTARGQSGQQEAAANLRGLLQGSRRLSSTDDQQDAYSVRCAPQVHGASRDVLAHVRRIVDAELNAVTDNPLFFVLEGDQPPWDAQAARENAARHGRAADPTPAFSAGNFHGQPVGLAADVLCLGVAEIASIAERRIALLANPATSRGLPAHLAARPGLHSGLMLAQYTAASLVSENKTLSHPATVDSIPTGNGVEDHVPMSTWAARKARAVVALAARVQALELLVAAQAVDWRALLEDPAVTSQAPSGAAAGSLAEAFRSLREDDAVATLAPATASAHRALRELSPRVVDDRSLSDEVELVARAILAGRFLPSTTAG